MKPGETEVSDGVLVKRFANFANTMPLISRRLMLDWNASYQKEDQSWANVLNRYEDFPEDGKGGRLWECEVTVPGPNGKPISKEVRARPFIRWNAKEDTNIPQQTQQKTIARSQVEDVEVPKQTTSQPTQQKKTVVTPMDLDSL